MTKGHNNQTDVSTQMETLTEAFQQFSEETQRLEKAYGQLQAKFVAVSEQLQATEERLQKKMIELDLITHYLQNMVTHIKEGILFVSKNGQVTMLNKAAEKILGIKQKEALLQSFSSFLPDDILGFSLNEALTTHKAPPQVHISYREKKIDVSISFITKGPKEYQGAVLLLRDVTKIHKLQAQTQLNDRMKELGEMAAFVAHEIRNPLGGILGFASLLKRNLTKEENLEKVGHIIEGTQVLNQLVEDVLHYARPLKLKLVNHDLTKVLHKLITLLKADERTPKNITIIPKIAPTALCVELDENLLLSTLLNICINAFQAMPNGGTLSLTLTDSSDHALIQVTDTGVGIAKENLSKIFSPFFTTKEKGTGLGLSEAYKIIQGHCGKIEVASRRNEGTTFTISLPRGVE